MKIYLETFGCQMNRLDSELVTALLRTRGHQMVSAGDSADVVLFNTCSVREQAENKVLSRLGELPREPDGRIVGVLGCMAQRLGKSLRSRFPRVGVICAPGQLGRLPDMIDSAAAGRFAIALDASRGSGKINDTAGDSLDLARDPFATPSPAQAFVRVMRGCDNFCTYCIVPFVRGPEVSRKPEHIVEEVRRLVEAGRREITLIGQTVNRYHWRPAGEAPPVRFSDLLERVSGIAGLRRLRFVTSHPLDFSDDILHAMAGLPNVCEYIHCPAQSGSDAVLKRMHRRYTRAQYNDLVDRARRIVPGVVLAGDFIVGFPGETRADHQASEELIRRSGYKNSFVFKYSPRGGTAAAKNLPDNVSWAEKRRRNNDLLAVQAEVSLAHHKSYVGKTVEVLVEGPSVHSERRRAETAGVRQLTGRTRGDHIVVFDSPDDLAGQYVNMKITGASTLILFGDIGG